jgi:hypothetical protein
MMAEVIQYLMMKEIILLEYITYIMANRPLPIVIPQPLNYSWDYWRRSRDPIAPFFRSLGERFVRRLEDAEIHPSNVNNELLRIINGSLNQWVQAFNK